MPGAALFVLSARVSVTPPERRELVQALLAWLASVRLTAGFVGGHVAEDLEVQGAYMFSSAWRRWEDMDAHMVGPDFGVLLGALEVLGRDTQLVLTAATEGAEDGWSRVRRLRGRNHPLQAEVDGVAGDPTGQPPAGGAA